MRCLLLTTLVLVAVACEGMDDGGMDNTGMDDGGMLGGGADTSILAEVEVASLPDGPLAWTAFEVAASAHSHTASFVYAHNGQAQVLVDGEEHILSDGDALFVPARIPHEHGHTPVWETVLAQPDAGAPEGAASPIFSSDALQGVPQAPVQLRFVLVELPAGAQTSVHTHPGPEYIYVLEGGFIYENGIIGAVETGPGDDHTLPAGTPVQKRNDHGQDRAVFLSWFVVPPDEPFAPPTEFASSGGR